MAGFQSLYRKKTRDFTAKETEDTGIPHYRFHINFAVYGRVSIIAQKKQEISRQRKLKTPAYLITDFI